MVDMIITAQAREVAFKRVVTSIDMARALPEQVFLGAWTVFLFFEADRLFAPDFATIARSLLRAEQASVCCLVNFSESSALTYKSGAKLFVDAMTQPLDYDLALRAGGPVAGWLFSMDRYGCASDKAGWSIYCEKGNDVAVVALRQVDDVNTYAEALAHLAAASIDSLLADSSAPVPFGQLTETWRRGLTEHYTHGTDQGHR